MKLKKHLLSWKSVFLLLFFLMVLSVPARAAQDTFALSIKGTMKYREAYKVLDYTNKVRKSVGAKPLTMDMDLMNAAMQRAAEIALVFDHLRPNGTDCFSASPKMFGENIAAGQSSASSVVNSWKNSPGHYRNMVNSSYSSIGIGCFYFNGSYYWVQCFGYDNIRKGSRPSDITKTVSIQVHPGWIYAGASLVADGLDGTLSKGKTATIKLYFVGTSAFGRPTPISWKNFRLTSSRPDILAVTGEGKVTAKKAGKATVTLQHKDFPALAGSVSCTVSDANSRTVVFNANGGSFSKSSSVKTQKATVTYKKSYGKLPAPTRKGYTFSGWYTKKSGGSKITSSKKVTISKGKTQNLYAHWKKVSVKRASLSKLSRKNSTTANVTWKKLSGAKGYEVCLSTSKSFSSSTTQKKLLKSGSARSAAFSGMKKGRTYYCRVRAYQTDSLGNRIYGKYSSTKSLKWK